MAETFLRPTVSVRGVLSGPQGKLLVLQRTSDGEWELPGGRLNPHESVPEGLQREVREETSLPLEIDDILLANSWLNDQNNDRFAVYYVCRTFRTSVSLSEEHMNSQWVTPAEATSILSSAQSTAVRRSYNNVGTETADREALGNLAVDD
jgi:8-oxo-dGTP pyrophosphatase MutT (NUDIX family)